jgi:hypothetical protein
MITYQQLVESVATLEHNLGGNSTWTPDRVPEPIRGLVEEREKPTEKLALFFCKKACSLEDGHHEHYYYDKGLEPPKRIHS